MPVSPRLNDFHFRTPCGISPPPEPSKLHAAPSDQVLSASSRLPSELHALCPLSFMRHLAHNIVAMVSPVQPCSATSSLTSHGPSPQPALGSLPSPPLHQLHNATPLPRFFMWACQARETAPCIKAPQQQCQGTCLGVTSMLIHRMTGVCGCRRPARRWDWKNHMITTPSPHSDAFGTCPIVLDNICVVRLCFQPSYVSVLHPEAHQQQPKLQASSSLSYKGMHTPVEVNPASETDTF